jgi:hypothetical protein
MQWFLFLDGKTHDSWESHMCAFQQCVGATHFKLPVVLFFSSSSQSMCRLATLYSSLGEKLHNALRCLSHSISTYMVNNIQPCRLETRRELQRDQIRASFVIKIVIDVRWLGVEMNEKLSINQSRRLVRHFEFAINQLDELKLLQWKKQADIYRTRYESRKK